jgi:hypothetical protein
MFSIVSHNYSSTAHRLKKFVGVFLLLDDSVLRHFQPVHPVPKTHLLLSQHLNLGSDMTVEGVVILFCVQELTGSKLSLHIGSHDFLYHSSQMPGTT